MTSFKSILLVIIVLIVFINFVNMLIIYKSTRQDKMKILSVSNYIREHYGNYTGYIIVINQHLIDYSPNFVLKIRTVVEKFGQCLVINISNADEQQDVDFLQDNEIIIIPTILYFVIGSKVKEILNFGEFKEIQKDAELLQRIQSVISAKRIVD